MDNRKALFAIIMLTASLLACSSIPTGWTFEIEIHEKHDGKTVRQGEFPIENGCPDTLIIRRTYTP